VTDYQPIDYRLRCHTKRTDLPADVLRDIGEAYAEIQRLQRERDMARRTLCNEYYMARNGRMPVEEIAKEMEWDCFKENTND